MRRALDTLGVAALLMLGCLLCGAAYSGCAGYLLTSSAGAVETGALSDLQEQYRALSQRVAELPLNVLNTVLAVASIGIALIGIVGYGLLSASIEANMSKRYGQWMSDTLASLYTTLAYNVWLLADGLEREAPNDPLTLRHAKAHVDLAVNLLINALEVATESPPDEPKRALRILQAKNGLAYHYATRHRDDSRWVDKAGKEKRQALEYSREVLEASKEHRGFEYQWVDTFIYVRLCLCKESSLGQMRREWEEALAILQMSPFRETIEKDYPGKFPA